MTFNATVTPASGTGTPTGSVTFMDGTTTLAMMSLSERRGQLFDEQLGGGGAFDHGGLRRGFELFGLDLELR